MTDINVTQAAVRNLATALSKIDTSKLRHTERLEIIAAAFGWKADAFMHALKKSPSIMEGGSRSAIPATSPARGHGRAIPSLEDLGIRDLREWMTVISSGSGLCFTCGATASGKTTVLDASAKYLAGTGRDVMWHYDADGRGEIVSQKKVGDWADAAALSRSGPVMVFGEIRDAQDADAAFDLATNGWLVLASLHAATPASGMNLLMEHMSLSPDRLSVVRGAMSQCLVRKVCGHCDRSRDCSHCGGSGYKGRTIVSAVTSFPNEGALQRYRAAPADLLNSILDDVVEKRAAGIVDLMEIERCFGSVFVSMLSDVGNQRLHSPV